jgi:site-specific DNA-methyltransferase (adenine-specific)
MKTKLFLVLLGISKQTQAGGGEEYRYVPVQDFSVLWTDEMLYQKYGITEEEQAYIDQILGVSK